MARVLISQLNDGVTAVADAEVFGRFSEQIYTPELILAEKVASAERYGWEYEWLDDGTLHTWKTYPPGSWCRRKDRYLRTVE